MDDPVRWVILAVVFAYSCILHECAHVWVALKLGDPTGKMEGRLTLNPIPHIDPFWTILLPVMSMIFSGFPIGGPKPAPVNPLNFRNPRVGQMWTALAGPGTNLLLAAAAFGLLWVLHQAMPDLAAPESYNAFFFVSVMILNLVLAALNLIPVPPLDGSRFLQYLLGPRGDTVMSAIERLGVIPVFVAFYFLGRYAIAPFFFALTFALYLAFESDYAHALLGAFRR